MESTLLLATEDRLAGEALTSTLKTKGYKVYFHSQHLSNIDRLLIAHHPSIVLIGEALVDSLGGQLNSAIGRLDYQPRCAFILSSGSAGLVVGGLKNGITGFIHNNGGLQDLLQCLKALEQGSTYISPGLSGTLTETNGNNVYAKAQNRERLTSRELQILQLIRQNKTSREIAEILNLSIKTVQNHRQNMCYKLGLKGRNKLYEYALQHFRGG